jgi:predicted XRE-type DNA-binding protein
MRKVKWVEARTAAELAEVLGLPAMFGIELEVRSAVLDKLAEVVKKSKLTHAQVAKLSGTSRTRITAILNHGTVGVSTDLLLRILGRLGYRASIRFSRAA